MNTPFITRVRELIAEGQMTRAGLARAAGLHANTLRDCLEALGHPRVFAFSTRSATRYDAIVYRRDDALLFGSETRGLPDDVIAAIPEENRLRLPMRAGQRSLNLSNAVAVAVFEAWRQFGYVGGE